MKCIKHIVWGILMLGAFEASAQEKLLNLGIETRIDYLRESIDGVRDHESSGFKGQELSLDLDGEIGHGFSYAYRQRLNTNHDNESFFDATDWLHLTYTTPNERWAFSAGKQVVGIGGYEYDLAPIDCYFYSEYCSNIACYQLGASITHTLKNGNDSFMAQVTESPACLGEEMFAYNLMWMGEHDWFESIYSVNAMEYIPNEYIYYIALGNRFTMGPVVLELDFMNRATDHQTFFFRNCSVMGTAKVEVCPYVQLQAKVSYDVNRTDNIADFCVAPGTELTRVGGAVEFFPIKGKRNVRLHAAYCYTMGSSDTELTVLQDKHSRLDIGLTWRMNLLSFAHPKAK
ncbi:MAG: porin [Alistipes sp.]|nr:porin [Alistipes sp.]